MGSVVDLIDNSKAVLRLTDTFLRWAVTSVLKRLATIVFVGIFYTCGFYLYVGSLQDEAVENSKAVQRNVDFVLQDNLYQSVIDWARLCIDTRERKSANAGWYCDKSIELYKLRSNGTPPPLRDEIITRRAYEAIIIDMSSQLRGVAMDKLYKQSPAGAQELLERILGKTGMALFFICFVSVMLATASALIWYVKRSVRYASDRIDIGTSG